MNYEANVLLSLYKQLNEQPVINDMKEIIFAKAEFDMNKATGIIDFGVRKSNEDYLHKEKEWYASKSLNALTDITIWNNIKDLSGQVNSNYGYLVYSKGNFNQFHHVVKKLKEDRNTRQAIILYNRPSIHLEAKDLGGRDFICTLAQHFFIRDNKLHCIVSMRSCDAFYGLFYDLPWFEIVYNNVFNSLENIEKGSMIFTANSFHCYKKHFSVLENICSCYNKIIH